MPEELDRKCLADVYNIAISYHVVFLYIALFLGLTVHSVLVNDEKTKVVHMYIFVNNSTCTYVCL